MKTTILTLGAALVLIGGTWLRAQEGEETAAGTASEESKTAMVEQCTHMCAIQFNPESPGSLLAWKQELSLTDDQAASLRTVEEKAITDAKALLSAEQLTKLQELAKNMQSQSMMQFMQGNRGESMMHGKGMVAGKGMMHGKGMMQGMKDKTGDAMPMCCSPMH